MNVTLRRPSADEFNDWVAAVVTGYVDEIAAFGSMSQDAAEEKGRRDIAEADRRCSGSQGGAANTPTHSHGPLVTHRRVAQLREGGGRQLLVEGRVAVEDTTSSAHASLVRASYPKVGVRRCTDCRLRALHASGAGGCLGASTKPWARCGTLHRRPCGLRSRRRTSARDHEYLTHPLSVDQHSIAIANAQRCATATNERVVVARDTTRVGYLHLSFGRLGARALAVR